MVANVGVFKKVKRKCSKCLKQYTAYEENGTDVAIASKMASYAAANLFDKALLFSADSDLVPVVRIILQDHEDKEVHIVTTTSRIRNAKELRSVSSGYISIDQSNFEKNLLPRRVFVNGSTIDMPLEYEHP